MTNLGQETLQLASLGGSARPFHHNRNVESEEVIKSLAALAQPVRLQVFRALVVSGKDGLTPGTMSDGLGIAPNTLSFHLKELTHAGLVTQQRSSRHIIYRAAYERMNALVGYLAENCCQGADCGIESAGASRGR